MQHCYMLMRYCCAVQTDESWIKHPFWQDKKDHCVLRYKKALCRQIKKQLDTQEKICKEFPCSTDACSLRVSLLQHYSIFTCVAIASHLVGTCHMQAFPGCAPSSRALN